ncbi:hypothetical protein G7Z17_g2599 [Cylindrodendrum hubeiense]|uniref:Uncharacterized protein n=1 Tax=Cylindrodendrum hubeiense TaxID=595255 RepID=A0A9P5LIZ5_9HYPO|nr:hypothetical protein G7Z17_g2599 [Cylindrodendrum hubeiense]
MEGSVAVIILPVWVSSYCEKKFDEAWNTKCSQVQGRTPSRTLCVNIGSELKKLFNDVGVSTDYAVMYGLIPHIILDGERSSGKQYLADLLNILRNDGSVKLCLAIDILSIQAKGDGNRPISSFAEVDVLRVKCLG